MENFKDKYQTNLPEITSQETQEAAPTSDNEVGTQAGEQGLQPDLCDPESTGLDTLLKRLMDPNTQPEPLDKPKSLTASKRPRNKRKLKQPNASAKLSYNPPMYGGKSNSNKDSTIEPMHKKRKTSPSAGTQSDYVAPKQAPKQIKEPISREETKPGLRRSPRMPRATAKYWDSIKAELRNPNQDE